jgi:hypothetical protein
MLFPDDRNILGTSEGLFVIRAESALTNVSSADFNLGLDYTNPVIESIVPYENIYSGIMHIDVSAFDSLSGIERIDIEIIDKNTGVVHRTYTDIEYNSVTGFFDIDVNTLEEDSEGNKYLPDGSYNIAGYAYDVAGNSSTLRVDPGVDNTKPILYASSIGLSYNPIIRGRLLHIDINASDNFSGVNNVTAKVYRESTTGNCESANPEASWAILSGGRYWAWASPCDGGCSVADPNKVEGWRYATEEEWANRPAQSEFLDIYGNVICAASQFDNTYSHCDYGNPEERIPTGSWHESWYIYDCTATTELVEMATIPLELTSGNVLEGIWSADYNVPSTWSTEGKYTIVFDANDTALNPNNAVDVNEETSVIKDYSFGVANQSGYSPKVFTIDGNFRDDEGNVPGVDANTILITSSVVGVTSVSFDENGSFRITTNNLRVGTYYIDLTYNTSDFNYTTRISLSVTNAPPLRGGGGSGAGRSAPEVVDENVPVEETGPTTPEEIEGGEETLEEPLVVEETPVVAAPEVVQPTGPTGLFGLGEAGNYIPLGLLALLVLGGLWFVLFKRK